MAFAATPVYESLALKQQPFMVTSVQRFCPASYLSSNFSSLKWPNVLPAASHLCTFSDCAIPAHGRSFNKSFFVFALSDGIPGASGDFSFDPSKIKTRRDMLIEYVKNVQPEFMERFMQRTPEQVVEAMRQTVTNMLGTLPPQFFEVTVTTVGENLAQLMYSVMMTGYMFRNAQYRIDLSQTLAPALPAPTTSLILDSKYEPGVQKTRVRGEVLRWHKVDGPEAMDAVQYIEMLESELLQLQRQLESDRRSLHGSNQLLEYLKSLEPQNLHELTASAGEDAVEAMNVFIHRLLGVSDAGDLKKATSETTAVELAKLLFWLMVVGYSIRNIEVRFDMEKVLAAPPKLPELPPGEL